MLIDKFNCSHTNRIYLLVICAEVVKSNLWGGHQLSPQHRIQIKPLPGLESDAPEEQSRGGRDGGVLGEGQDGGVGREADGDGHHEHGGAQGADQV